jgi:hypothetical protein
MYHHTTNQTFGHGYLEVARELNAVFAPDTLEVGPYRRYEQAPQPAFDPGTQRIEPSNTITERTGAPWLRGWNIVARTAEDIAAEQAAHTKQAERESGSDLLAQARTHPLFVALQSATWPQIDGYIDNKFPTLNADQRNVLKLLTVVAQAVLKERA